jgi:anaerobic C4-dicarboxylate transporter
MNEARLLQMENEIQRLMIIIETLTKLITKLSIQNIRKDAEPFMEV